MFVSHDWLIPEALGNLNDFNWEVFVLSDAYVKRMLLMLH
jgi:hypothetical protein